MPKNNQVFIDIGQGLSIMIGLPTISTWNTTNRPKKAKIGTFGFNVQTNNLEYWDGRNWFASSMTKA